MRILISGATGLIGSALVPHLQSQGNEVARLVRSASARSESDVLWDPVAGELDPSQLEDLDAVVHLAGENITARRWSQEQKKRIRNSRVNGTGLLATTLAGLNDKPSVLMCASASGFYGDRGDEVLPDDASPGSDFLATSTKEWEDASKPAAEVGIRVVNMRFGLVFTASGGMLGRVLPIFKMGLGGKLGSGRQYMSWITRQDLVRAVEWIIHHDEVSGAANVSTPEAVTNAEFTKALGRAVKRPAFFTVPEFALRITQGEVTDAVLASVRMKPRTLVDSGFEFEHPDLDNGLRWALTDTEL